jgi:hypothetical protein
MILQTIDRLLFGWALLVFCCQAAPAVAIQVVLNENFNELPEQLAATSVGAFMTINGTNVDIIGPEYGGCPAPESGNCVDMNGSGGNPQGQLQSTMVFAPGSYLLSFDLMPTARTGDTLSVTVTLGNYNQTFVLTYGGSPSSGIVLEAPVTVTTPSQLLFASNVPGNIGLVLDNVVVSMIVAAPPVTSLGVGSEPIGIAFDGANLWVANSGVTGAPGPGGNTITKLRALDGVTLGIYPAGGVPAGVVFDGANIWVANNASSSVSEMRASDGSLLGVFPISGLYPYAITFDGANIWVTSVSGTGTDLVTKLRASDGTTLGIFEVGKSPDGVAFDGANIWVTNSLSNNVTELRASDGFALGTFPVGNTPHGIVFDGTNLWVANYGSNTVMKVRTSDGTILGTYPSGAAPFGLLFDGANIWVSDYRGNAVTELRSIDGTALAVYAVGINPNYLAFDGANIWVTNEGSDTVSKISVPLLLSPCAVTDDGATSVVDVQLITNEVLGVMPGDNDLNDDGVVNVVDVQVAINAALGLGCLGG